MTLLSIANAVADEVGLPRSASISSGTDQLSRQMFALANATLEDLADLPWPVLIDTYSFDTVVGQETYDPPPGWNRFVTDTAFLSTVYYQMRGSLTPYEWQRRKNGLPSEIGRYRYRVFGSPLRLHITPTPQTVETIVVEYISSNLAFNADSDRIPQYQQDSDTAVVPEEVVRKGLKWRIKHAKGLDYSEDFNAYQRTRDTLLAQQLNLGSMPVAKRYYADIPELGDGYVPEDGYGW